MRAMRMKGLRPYLGALTALSDGQFIRKLSKDLPKNIDPPRNAVACMSAPHASQGGQVRQMRHGATHGWI